MTDRTETTEGRDPLLQMEATLKSVQRWSEWPDEGDLCSIEAGIAEIKQLREEVAALKIELEGAAHNRFYDQRDAYFEGVEDGR